VGDAHGQRAKIVQRGNFDFPGFDRLKNTGQKTEANAVAQLRPLEAKRANFAQHGPPVAVAMGIPAGGE